MTAKLVKVDHIVIIRAEGPIGLCGKKQFATSFAEASKILAGIAQTAPKDGGYDKVDFKVYFEDDETYEGRADIEHKHVTGYHLGEHIRNFITFMAGERCPAHMTQERYDSYIRSTVKPEEREEYKKYLTTYDLT